METKANHLIVGSFVLILAAGLLFFIVWIAKFQVAATFTRYDIFFDGSVTGLVEGSAVRYSGVKVGEVVFIGLDRQNPNQVRAMIEVEAETPIRTDTVASLELEGLAGGRYILLRGGSPEAPPLISLPISVSRAAIASETLRRFSKVLERFSRLLSLRKELACTRSALTLASTSGAPCKTCSREERAEGMRGRFCPSATSSGGASGEPPRSNM